MPRKVKRVKAARSQKQKRTKKFWILLSSMIAVAIAAIATIVVLVIHFSSKDDSYDYFKDMTDETSLTWNAAKKEKENVDHMFIFYWSEENFNPSDKKSDEELEENITKLYNKIVEYNESMKDSEKYEAISFALVKTDTPKGKPALTDSESGITETLQLAYYYDGTYTTYPYGITDPKNPTEEEIEKYGDIINLHYELNKANEAISFIAQLMSI